MEKSISFRKIATIAGAMCAYWMGSGFATGQEILQFFTSSGIKGILSTIIFLVITGSSTYFIASAGQKEQFENPFDIFVYYCGKWIGNFYIWLSVVVMYCVLIVILAGAGASLHQFYGVPTYAGIIIIGVLALSTVLLGVQKIIRIISSLSFVQILFLLILGGYGITSLAKDPNIILKNSELIQVAAIKTPSPHWALSAILYAFFTTIVIVPFLVSSVTIVNNLKEARIATISGTVIFTLSIIILIIAELIYYKIFVGKQVPTLAIAYHISPYFGSAFTLIIVIASYSAVSSNLLIITRRFAAYKTKKYNIVAFVLILVAIICSGAVPFALLINILFPTLAYSTIIFIALMLYKELKKFHTRKNH